MILDDSKIAKDVNSTKLWSMFNSKKVIFSCVYITCIHSVSIKTWKKMV